MSLSCLTIAFAAASAVAQPPPTERNLLPNPSFEESEGGQVAVWSWEPGSAKATLTLDDTVAHSGRRSLRITNPTPASPHVYGRLLTPVRLTPGRTYTLSCYVRTDDPGTAWIGTGRGWQFRFPLPVARDWTRVVGAFEADDSSLQVMILSESVTPGIWVDDVQLEPGASATPYVYREPLQPGQTELTVLQGDWVSVAPNLVENSGFETLDGGLPKSWSFDRRNTDGAMAVDETVAHSGQRSLKFTNGTTFGAHVYSLLSYGGGLKLEPNRDYTLSCYVRSADPGVSWIGGGPGWSIRLHFPRTEGNWERIVQSFRTGDDVAGFPLLVVSESPTEGFWIDDVKLEAGPEPTPYMAEDGADRAQVSIDAPRDVQADAELRLGAWVCAPTDLRQATLTFRLTPDGPPGSERSLEARWTGALYKGAAYIAFRCGIPRAAASAYHAGVEVAVEQRTAGSASAWFALHTVGPARDRLAATRERAQAVRALFDQARAKGFDAAYPLVSLTVADNFCDFISEDLDHLQVIRASEQLDELAGVLDRAEKELRGLLDEGAKELPVPRYVTSPIDIQGTSFVATVRWPDGRQERRPVFFTGYGHFGSVRRDVEKFPDYGLNCIQVEFGPKSTVVGETEDSAEPVEVFERLLERAAASNVAVNLLLSPHYFPQWAYDKWPEIGGVEAGFMSFSVDAPQARAVIERHLRLTASRLKGRPGLHSYCLSNEPIYVDPSKDPCNAQQWAAWLHTRYGAVEALNAAHRAAYGSFENVPVPAKQAPKTTPLFYDWCRFNNQRFAGWHAWMANVIHEEDLNVPVHAKTMNTLFYHAYQGWGIDQQLFCDLSQIAGNDSCKWYTHEAADWANGWQPENMHLDLLRSCRGQPSFNSENHVIIDGDSQRVPGVHLRNVLWQAAIHGEGASTMWVWERTFDPHSALAGSIMHRPECADAHGRVALDLMRLAPEVTDFQQAPARIAVIYSIASLVYGGQESERQLHRVYHALNFLGEKLDFITEPQLAAGKASEYQVLVAPGITHLPPEALRRLADFDGLVLTAGDGCLAKDDLDRPSTFAPAKRTVALSAATGRDLRDETVRLLGDILPRTVVLRDADTGAEAWGVEYQTARTDRGLLVNLVNYTQKPLRVTLGGLKEEPVNLFTGEPASQPLELQPLEPVLLR